MEMKMHTNFKKYYQMRKSVDFTESICSIDGDIRGCGLTYRQWWERHALPKLVEAQYENVDELLNEIGLRSTMNWLRGKNQPQQEDPESDTMKQLNPVNQTDPRAFRPMVDRNVSQSDLRQNQKDTAQANVDADNHNQGVQKRRLINQQGEKLKQVRDQMNSMQPALITWLQTTLKNVWPAMSKKLVPHKLDIAKQFFNYLVQASRQFQPKIDLSKYQQDADLSGVKSGLGDEHKVGKQPDFYSKTGATPGVYDDNQVAGNAERADRQASQAAAVQNMKRVTQQPRQPQQGIVKGPAPRQTGNPMNKAMQRKEHAQQQGEQDFFESLANMSQRTNNFATWGI